MVTWHTSRMRSTTVGLTPTRVIYARHLNSSPCTTVHARNQIACINALCSIDGLTLNVTAGSDGVQRSGIDLFYATATDHLNIRTIQTWQSNMAEVLANSTVRLSITCNNGRSSCVDFCVGTCPSPPAPPAPAPAPKSCANNEWEGIPQWVHAQCRGEAGSKKWCARACACVCVCVCVAAADVCVAAADVCVAAAGILGARPTVILSGSCILPAPCRSPKPPVTTAASAPRSLSNSIACIL